MTYKHYESWVKKHCNKDGIRNLHTNRGGDYLSNEYTQNLKANGWHLPQANCT